MEVEVEYLEVNMCVLCLHEKSVLITIDFDETLEPNTGAVLVKHLWFEQEELHFKYICQGCWEQVKDFHDFYISIAKTHAEMKFSSGSNRQELDIKEESTSLLVSIEEVHSSEYVEVKQEPSKCGETTVSEVFQTCANPDQEKAEVEQEEYLEVKSDESTSEEDSSEDEDSASEDSLKKTPKGKKRGKNKSSSTDPEKLEKIYHKSMEQIEEEDKLIYEHCKLGCDECNASFVNVVEFKRHFREVHGDKAHVVCCNRKFSKRSRLVDHVTRHMNPDAFMCTLCNKSYSNSAGLNLHMAKHGSPESFVHKCDKCEKSFAKRFQLTAHQLQHVPEEDRKCVCTECNKAFANKFTLQSHIKGVHQMLHKIICAVCAKLLSSKQAWINHMKVHTEVLPSKKLQCQQCGSWHKNSNCLEKHKKRHHSMNRKYQCPDCDKVCTTTEALRGHRTYAHRLKPDQICHVCGKAFKRALSLKEHMSLHTGQALYQCSYCDRQFKSSANMFAHRKREHRDQWEHDLKLNLDKGKQ